MKFTYEVGVYGTLTREEADMVYLHLKEHPDTKLFIEQGGFGFSFVNYYAGQDVTTEFKFSKIDTMLKALECPLQNCNIPNFNKELKRSIIKKLENWCNSINKEYTRLCNEQTEKLKNKL